MSYYFYFLKGEQQVRVCKDFYLSTLSVDAKRIVNTHKSKNQTTGTPSLYKRGKHVKKSFSDRRCSVRKHIESIPRIESHYCRRDTNKEYIDETLNMRVLYEKYVEHCSQTEQIPAKEHTYRHIFNHEYNIEFQKPKKDRCDICEAMKFNKEPTADETQQYAMHIDKKKESHEERNRDRESVDKIVVCFDMQNVFSPPQSNVSNFFYKRKLSVFHLTGHCSTSKQSYGAVWPETLSGRSGNDIASGLVRILGQLISDLSVTDYHSLERFLCSSESEQDYVNSIIIAFESNTLTSVSNAKVLRTGS